MKSREDRRKCEFSRGARRKGKGAEEPPGGSWRLLAALRQTESTREALGVARQGGERPLQKCVVTHFAARGPRGPLEAWRCAAGGALGALWNPGDAF